MKSTEFRFTEVEIMRDVTEYASTYGQMNDEQLLNLANDRGSLCPEALVALKSELAKRNFGQIEIDEQAQSVRKLQTEWDNRGDLGRSFNGFGTSIYGKRNFQSDGSFITTQWIILFWIPFIPLKSFRVKESGPTRPAFLGWSQSYFVLGRSRPDIRQVINVYSFLVAPFVVLPILDSMHAGSIVGFVALVMWICTPFVARKFAKASSVTT